MNAALHVVQIAQIVLALICAGGAAYQCFGALLLPRWLSEPCPPSPEPLPPVTLLRPVKAGVPHLAAKLDALARAMHPRDQLILGAADASRELAECAAVQRAHPQHHIVVIPCREGAASNPKISKLLQMHAAIAHEHLILSDSEAVIDAAWLDALRHEWRAHPCAALTTPYRFAGAITWPQRLDAAAVRLSLLPGLTLVRRWGSVDFTLGACTALRRSLLEEVGGWAAFGDFLAEDRMLGAALAERGGAIRLAATVATLDADPLTWRDWWRHQRRVAITYRIAAPVGFAGTAFTHGASAALLLMIIGLVTPSAWSLGWALVTISANWAASSLTARRLGIDCPDSALILLVAGCAESATWLLSWFSRKPWWSGRWWRLSREGRLS